MDNNVYLLRQLPDGPQVLIDAADAPERILELISAGTTPGVSTEKPGLAAVITTHSHWDHVRALAEVLSATGAEHLAGQADAAAMPAPVTVPLENGQQLDFGGLRLEVIGLRGHTPGSIALLYEAPGTPPQLFTGDSLFPGGVGNTENDPQRFGTLIDDVEQRIFDRLPDGTVVHPGHGRETTLGAERPHLAAWRARGW